MMGAKGRGRWIAAGLVALLMAGGASAALAKTARKAPPAKTRPAPLVSIATAYGFRVGPEQAATRLVEYGSMNCPHCADVTGRLDPAIRAGVRAGTMSFEWRPHVLFAADVPVTLAARCVAPSKAMAMIDAYYRGQAAFRSRLSLRAKDQAWARRLDALQETDSAAFAREVASTIQLAPFVAGYGLDVAALDACLGNRAMHDWLNRAHVHSMHQGVHQTPTLFVNETLLDWHSYGDIGRAIGADAKAQAALDAAL